MINLNKTKISFSSLLGLSSILSFFLFVSLINQSSSWTCHQLDYTFNQLVLTWPGQFCSQNYCIQARQDSWNQKDFTIHGYWPASQDLSYMQCQKQGDKQKDQLNCNSFYYFNESNLPGDTSFKNELKQKWTQLQNNYFWANQWNKHGTCYLNLTKQELNTKQSDLSIFQRYFKQTLAKANTINQNKKLTKGIYTDANDLAKDLHVSSNNFVAICKDDNQIDEIRFCYNLTGKNEQMISCPSVMRNDRNVCSGRIVFKDIVLGNATSLASPSTSKSSYLASSTQVNGQLFEKKLAFIYSLIILGIVIMIN